MNQIEGEVRKLVVFAGREAEELSCNEEGYRE